MPSITPTATATAIPSATPSTRKTKPAGPSVGTPLVTASIPLQDISSSGPLTHIFVSDDLSSQVAHASDSTYEFYPPNVAPGDLGTFLVVDGYLYTPNFESHGTTATTGDFSASSYFTPVSQSAVSGSGTAQDPFRVVTVADAGTTGIRVTQTDSYVAGDNSYRTDLQISNSGATAHSLIVYRAGDCYLAGSDVGYGFVDTAAKAVGCAATPNNNPEGRFQQWLPITGGNNYYEDFYDNVWSTIGSRKPFGDVYNGATSHDNAAGISWSVALAPGGQTTLSHQMAFAKVLSKETVVPDSSRYLPAQNVSTTTDPVITLTGSYAYSHTDLAVAGRGPAIAFARAFNSSDTRVGPLGAGWTHTYNMRLTDPGDGTGNVLLVGPLGRTDKYARQADGSYSAPPGIYTTLVKNANGTYTATHQDQTTWLFASNGRLAHIADRYGN
ncbi:MAG TPA: DUF6531 domain-containing protein, partial [Chloroflexota bacterium]